MDIYLGLDDTPIICSDPLFQCIKQAAKQLYLDPLQLPFARIFDGANIVARVEIDREIATGNVGVKIIALDSGLT